MPPTETEKQELHSLLDRVPPSELDIVKRFLELIAKANHQWPSLQNAPIDDEPETAAERAAVAEAKEWFKKNPEGIPFEEVLAEHGLSADDLRKCE